MLALSKYARLHRKNHSPQYRLEHTCNLLGVGQRRQSSVLGCCTLHILAMCAMLCICALACIADQPLRHLHCASVALSGLAGSAQTELL